MPKYLRANEDSADMRALLWPLRGTDGAIDSPRGGLPIGTAAAA